MTSPSTKGQITKAEKKVDAKTAEAKKEVTEAKDAVVDAAEATVKKVRLDVKAMGESARESLLEATTALVDTSELLGKNRHEVMFAILDNARVNTESSIKTMRAVLAADSLKDSIEIQREAIKIAFDRNVEQAREISTMAFKGSKDGFKPATDYIVDMSNKVMKKEAA